ncbi:MAG: sialidase family protein [Chitinophagaceae bacterium]
MIWEERGPNNIGGRTRALIYDKNIPNKLFMGGSSGGLWTSTNNGNTWSKVENTDMTSAISICSITQAANGDIYYGTGEGHYSSTGNFGGGQLGEGIWKSTDGGVSFTHLNSTTPSNANHHLMCGLL